MSEAGRKANKAFCNFLYPRIFSWASNYYNFLSAESEGGCLHRRLYWRQARTATRLWGCVACIISAGTGDQAGLTAWWFSSQRENRARSQGSPSPENWAFPWGRTGWDAGSAQQDPCQGRAWVSWRLALLRCPWGLGWWPWETHMGSWALGGIRGASETWHEAMTLWEGFGNLGRGIRLSRLISALGIIQKPYRNKF